MIPAVANHLWQSTLFAGVAALLALSLRKNRAHMRYRLWVAASIKFLVPFSVLVSAASRIEWSPAPAGGPPLAAAIGQISEPFTLQQLPVSTPAASSLSPAIAAAVTVWLIGCAVVLARWLLRWRRIRSAVRAAEPLPIPAPIEVRSCATLLEPGVFGVFRPVLLLPEGIAGRLTPAQLRAVLAHELCHVRRRDNLAAAVHMLVEALFWFHPLVWWIGARMVEERERACDEEVLRLGNEPEAYAAGIVNVCKFYLESPLACISGVTGADLKKRIEAIMTAQMSHSLTLAKKLLIATAGVTAVAGPILIGMISAPRGRAQAKPETLTFEVASVKPADPDVRGVRMQLTPGGGLTATNVRLRQLIEFAYEVNPSQISGGPGWMNSEGFDIIAKAPQPNPPIEAAKLTEAQREEFGRQVRQRIQALLADRFQLVVHRETKEMPVYALVVAKNGPKLKESPEAARGERQIRGRPGDLQGQSMTTAMLAAQLSRAAGRPVLDRTGLTGAYEVRLQWTPDPPPSPMKDGPAGPGMKSEGAGAADLPGPSLFTALQEQLGLKLEATRGPVEIIVIDRVEKPTPN